MIHVVKPQKYSVIRIYLRLIGMLGKDRPLSFVTYGLFMICQGLIPAIGILILADLFAVGTSFLLGESQVFSFLMIAIIYAVMVQLVEPLINMAANVMFKYIQRSLVASLELRIFSKVGKVRMEYFEYADFYVRFQRAHSVVTSGQFIRFLQRAANSIQNILTVVSIAGVSISFSPWLGICCAIAAIPITVLRLIRGKHFYELNWFQSPRQRILQYYSRILVSRREAKELRSFQLTDYFLDKWRHMREELRDERWEFERKNIKLELLFSTLTTETVAYALSIILAVYAVLRGDLAASGLAAALVAIQTFQDSFRKLLINLVQSVEGSRYIADLFHFMDTAEEEKTGTKQLPVPLKEGIQVEGLSFVYPGNHTPVFRNINCHIRPGERIAIVGENGAGKSTFVKLLLGIYEPTEGNITYDGIPLNSLDMTSFRAKLSVVMQDFMRYQYTLKDNIGFGETTYLDDEERVALAAEKGGVNTFVAQLPDQFNTRLGKEFPQSTDLSGGQWQRLATARGLMRSPQLLILDEPTAALDPIQEAEVFHRFMHMAAGRITMMVSHRMASCRLADRVFVIDDHRLAEVGTHQELMAKNGIYAQMYLRQAEWYQSNDN